MSQVFVSQSVLLKPEYSPILHLLTSQSIFLISSFRLVPLLLRPYNLFYGVSWSWLLAFSQLLLDWFRLKNTDFCLKNIVFFMECFSFPLHKCAKSCFVDVSWKVWPKPLTCEFFILSVLVFWLFWFGRSTLSSLFKYEYTNWWLRL